MSSSELKFAKKNLPMKAPIDIFFCQIDVEISQATLTPLQSSVWQFWTEIGCKEHVLKLVQQSKQ